MADYIAHFGIDGQKWGKRRWQYKDGSLTPAGRLRYGYNKQKNGRNFFEKIRDRISGEDKIDYSKFYNEHGQLNEYGRSARNLLEQDRRMEQNYTKSNVDRRIGNFLSGIDPRYDNKKDSLRNGESNLQKTIGIAVQVGKDLINSGLSKLGEAKIDEKVKQIVAPVKSLVTNIMQDIDAGATTVANASKTAINAGKTFVDNLIKSDEEYSYQHKVDNQGSLKVNGMIPGIENANISKNPVVPQSPKSSGTTSSSGAPYKTSSSSGSPYKTSSPSKSNREVGYQNATIPNSPIPNSKSTATPQLSDNYRDRPVLLNEEQRKALEKAGLL